MRVELFEIDQHVVARVESASTMSTTLVDWGKNAENVERFVTAPAFQTEA